MDHRSDVLARITVRVDVFGENPIVHDLRIAVEHPLGMRVAGDTRETILQECPELEREDIQASLRFAHRTIEGEHVHGRLPVREASSGPAHVAEMASEPWLNPTGVSLG